MSDICLSKDEIYEITGKVRYTAQVRELNRLRIPNQLRSNGSVLVFRNQMEPQLAKIKKGTPNFGALSSVA